MVQRQSKTSAGRQGDFTMSDRFALKVPTFTLRAVALMALLPAVAGFSQEQQTSSSAAVDQQTVQMLIERIDKLEASDRQLRERIAQLEGKESGSAATAGAPAGPQPTVSTTGSSAVDPAKTDLPKSEKQSGPLEQAHEMSEPDHMDVSKTLLNIRGFGDFGLYGGNQTGQTTSFSLGQLNLFITSNLAERFRFLTELVFEVHQDNDFEEDLERVLLEYSVNDYFKLSAGRYHTSIGYYNTAYHHATWFQTTTERPFIFEYEDEGGILPIHNVGVVASGQIPSGRLGLHYVAEVGNGRASIPKVEPVQNYVDENTHKSLNVAVFARPDALPGLQVGFSTYRDVLFPANSPRIGETIMDGYVVLTRPKFEWLNESVLIRHAPLGGRVFNTPAFYTQISERFGLYRPYFRYQYINASSEEPVFPQVGLRTGPSAGVRFDPTRSVALKLQYDYTVLQRQQPINGKSCPQLSMCAPSALGLQVDYTF
jgi:hypothetical protein